MSENSGVLGVLVLVDNAYAWVKGDPKYGSNADMIFENQMFTFQTDFTFHTIRIRFEIAEIWPK